VRKFVSFVGEFDVSRSASVVLKMLAVVALLVLGSSCSTVAPSSTVAALQYDYVVGP